MDAALAQVYDRVKDRVSRDEFLAKVEAARGDFDGLLDDEALGLLVLDEMGLNEGAYATLDDLKGRADATVRVVVERLDPPRTFERNGRSGRVGNVHVSDATGTCRMVLWDRDVDKMEDGTLKPGARLTLVNARVKEGPYGVELHVGPWSVLEVEGALDPAHAKLLADVQGDVAAATLTPKQTTLPTEDLPTELDGRLAWTGTTRPVRRGDGPVQFALEVDVETDAGIRRVVAWNAAVKAVLGIEKGARVRFDALRPTTRGATTEWHTTSETRVVVA